MKHQIIRSDNNVEVKVYLLSALRSYKGIDLNRYKGIDSLGLILIELLV